MLPHRSSCSSSPISSLQASWSIRVMTRPCLNPPKGRRPISTERLTDENQHATLWSQSPEGSTADFHAILSKTKDPNGNCLNPPKGRRPISTREADEVRESVAHHVSIPRRVDGRFPRRRQKAEDARGILSQSPEGSTADFHLVGARNLPQGNKQVMSQSPEGSTADFHSEQE